MVVQAPLLQAVCCPQPAAAVAAAGQRLPLPPSPLLLCRRSLPWLLLLLRRL
jgi:hypothetical protein